ncbi:MAG: choline monooxygenase [Myxococcota bacterium]|jgi:choline monooxygenase
MHPELGRFDPTIPLAAASTPPASWYVDPSIYAIEQRRVFARSWLQVARTDQLHAPGMSVGGCLAGLPWLVVRGDDGVLRAFHNVCRHKAALLVDGTATGTDLRCPYHGWRYRLDGRLLRAPRVAGIQAFDRDTLSLHPMAVAEWGPFVFINADAEAEPLVDQIPELDRLLSATGWADLRWRARRSYDVACNWKVFVDNYLDGGYHIPNMHPSLDAQLDLAGYRTETFAISSVQTSGASDGSDTALDVAARIGGGAIYGWLYPHFMLNRYGPVLDTNRIVPLGHDRCRVEFEFFFDAGVSDAFVAESMAQSEVTQLEDIAISESVQRGLGSPAYDTGRYAPELEVGEWHFHRLLAADLTG